VREAEKRPSPVLILFLVGVLIALCLYTPTRFFIKFTVLFGLPFLLLLAWWRRLKRFSLPWILASMGMIVLLTVYGLQMAEFPQKLRVKEITMQGDVLLAQGKYDEAITKYKEMEGIDPEKAQAKIGVARREKGYQEDYLKAKKLAEQGEKEEAVNILKSIPGTAKVHPEVRDLLRRLEEEH